MRASRSFTEGRFNYAASAEYFAATVPRLVEEGARLIGGDYGTRPEQSRRWRRIIRELKPVKVKKISTPATRSRVETSEPAVKPVAREEDVSILDQLKTGLVSIVELDSPKTLSMDKFLTGAKALKDAGASAVTLADNSLPFYA